MWNDAINIIDKIRKRSAKPISFDTKNKSVYTLAFIDIPLELTDTKVYIVTEQELSELRKHILSIVTLRTFFSVILNSNKGSRMFNIVGETWNPITGCLHYCRYCWARQLALTRLKNIERYRSGFKPRFNREELKKNFKNGVVFVSDMGDMFNLGVKDKWIVKVLKYIAKFPNTYFLFLTKNPQRYKDFLDIMPPNAILGATIETNRDDLYIRHRISRAPLPSERYRAMKDLDWPLKFISIEPILDFDLEVFVNWIKEINPFMVYIGYDNYEWRLPEPTCEKTLQLIERLSTFTLVIKKTIRPAWNEKQAVINFSLGGEKQSRKSKETTGDYERFKQYLSLMHEKAMKIMDNLRDTDKKYVEDFFTKYYPTVKEHYWTLKKLFSLAMYIPTFIQIGLAAIEKGRFDGVIYVDTHAGPGLAKIGKDAGDIVLGSPLLALVWPKVIGEKLKRFKKVAMGFSKLFFIEKDPYTYSVLNRIVKNMNSENVVLLPGDSNIILKRVKEIIMKEYKNPLVLMFIDPFGEFGGQILYNSFFGFTRDLAVDVILNVNAPSLARGLESKKTNSLELRETIKNLWGDLCNAPRAKKITKLCICYDNPLACDISIKDILEAYIHRLEIDYFRFIDTVPVEFEGKILYYLVFASKGKRSHEWLGNYIEYLRTKAPKDYKTLCNLWLQAKGKLKDLTEYVSQSVRSTS